MEFRKVDPIVDLGMMAGATANAVALGFITAKSPGTNTYQVRRVDITNGDDSYAVVTTPAQDGFTIGQAVPLGFINGDDQMPIIVSGEAPMKQAQRNTRAYNPASQWPTYGFDEKRKHASTQSNSPGGFNGITGLWDPLKVYLMPNQPVGFTGRVWFGDDTMLIGRPGDPIDSNGSSIDELVRPQQVVLNTNSQQQDMTAYPVATPVGINQINSTKSVVATSGYSIRLKSTDPTVAVNGFLEWYSTQDLPYSGMVGIWGTDLYCVSLWNGFPVIGCKRMHGGKWKWLVLMGTMYYTSTSGFYNVLSSDPTYPDHLEFAASYPEFYNEILVNDWPAVNKLWLVSGFSYYGPHGFGEMLGDLTRIQVVPTIDESTLPKILCLSTIDGKLLWSLDLSPYGQWYPSGSQSPLVFAYDGTAPPTAGTPFGYNNAFLPNYNYYMGMFRSSTGNTGDTAGPPLSNINCSAYLLMPVSTMLAAKIGGVVLAGKRNSINQIVGIDPDTGSVQWNTKFDLTTYSYGNAIYDLNVGGKTARFPPVGSLSRNATSDSEGFGRTNTGGGGTPVDVWCEWNGKILSVDMSPDTAANNTMPHTMIDIIDPATGIVQSSIGIPGRSGSAQLVCTDTHPWMGNTFSLTDPSNTLVTNPGSQLIKYAPSMIACAADDSFVVMMGYFREYVVNKNGSNPKFWGPTTNVQLIIGDDTQSSMNSDGSYSLRTWTAPDGKTTAQSRVLSTSSFTYGDVPYPYPKIQYRYVTGTWVYDSVFHTWKYQYPNPLPSGGYTDWVNSVVGVGAFAGLSTPSVSVQDVLWVMGVDPNALASPVLWVEELRRLHFDGSCGFANTVKVNGINFGASPYDQGQDYFTMALDAGFNSGVPPYITQPVGVIVPNAPITSPGLGSPDPPPNPSPVPMLTDFPLKLVFGKDGICTAVVATRSFDPTTDRVTWTNNIAQFNIGGKVVDWSQLTYTDSNNVAHPILMHPWGDLILSGGYGYFVGGTATGTPVGSPDAVGSATGFSDYYAGDYQKGPGGETLTNSSAKSNLQVYKLGS